MLVLALTDLARAQLGAAPGTRGVVVADVSDGSAAGAAGFRPGDLIVSMGGASIESVAQFYKSLNDAGTREIGVRAARQGREVALSLRK